MNSLHTTLLTVAATLAITAMTASAQVTLKASVPFAFTAGSDRVLAPGDYEIRANPGAAWVITNRETSAKTMIVKGNRTESKQADRPQLVFACRVNRCDLRQVNVGGGEPGYQFHAPRHKGSDGEEDARLVVVPIVGTNAD